MNRLNLKIAQKAKSDEIRAVRALLRREKDAAIKASLKAEINLLKAESSDLRDSANAERASIKAEIALTKAGNKVANETHQATLAQLGDQIKALRQER